MLSRPDRTAVTVECGRAALYGAKISSEDQTAPSLDPPLKTEKGEFGYAAPQFVKLCFHDRIGEVQRARNASASPSERKPVLAR
jgi:hypothetical protein